ncbi:unnamed protein product [Pylaiella littoralis]
MRGSVEDKRSPGGGGGGMRGGAGAMDAGVGGGGGGKRGDACLAEIQRLEKNRANRRNRMEKARKDRVAEEARNIANGNPGDVDFMGMIQSFRDQRAGTSTPHAPARDGVKICIAIRKRPTNSKERARKDHDAVSCFNPEVTVHDCKLRVDGISKYLDSVGFRFDHAFGEEEDNQLVYDCTAKPLVPFVLSRGRATVFAYGQTGSGKTFTMVGIQKNATSDLFEQLAQMPSRGSLSVHVSFFEIYGGRCQDLLNHRHRCVVREDGKGEVVIAGLEEKEAMDADGLEEFIADGNRNRTTHATESNDQSSRSHAICQICVRDNSSGRLYGKLSLIDLAGSERGADTKSHNRQRRMEGADINKSLLALKECIRALDSDSVHVPYRASKLTLVLKDSFTRKGARTVMIATVSPGASAADHTINTLRYADRVKENKVEQFKPVANAGPAAGAGSESGGRASPLDHPPPPPSPALPKPGAANASASAYASGGASAGAGAGAGGGTSSTQQAKMLERRPSGSSVASGGGGGGGLLSSQRSFSEFKSPSNQKTGGGGGSNGVPEASAGTESSSSRWAQAKGGPTSSAALGSGLSTPSKKGSLYGGARYQRSLSGPGSDGKRSSMPQRPTAESFSSQETSNLRGLRGKGAAAVRDGGGRGGGGGGGRAEAPAPERAGSGGGLESAGSDTASAASDINYMHESLRQYNLPEEGEGDEEGVVELHHTVQSLFEEEEALLNLHMNIIQENAELLTEEGRLLQQIQGDDVVDYDIDAYATRLSEILDRKMTLMSSLQTRLRNFRGHLEAEEKASVKVRGMHVPQY